MRPILPCTLIHLQLTPWFFTLNHTNYARWIPVHLRDMTEPSVRHAEIVDEFTHFTAQKSQRVFSSIPIDQAHEQNNACIKGDGGAVGLTDNPSALRRWMISGPEVARVISEFEAAVNPQGTQTVTLHHDQIPSVQQSFLKNVKALVSVFKEFGNPFQEDSKDMLVLDTREIVDPIVATSVYDAPKLGQQKFEEFFSKRLVQRTVPIDQPISRNKLPLFGNSTKAVSKSKHNNKSMKNDLQLFSRLHIACQTRDGNLDEFFKHENQAFPPSLSDMGKLRVGTKSDLLTCVEPVSSQANAPFVT